MISTLVLTVLLTPAIEPVDPAPRASPPALDGSSDDEIPERGVAETEVLSEPETPEERDERDTEVDSNTDDLTPVLDAMQHLDRALSLEARGDLGSAEAEASVAISLAPHDPAAYLARAQIRMKLAERPPAEDELTARRARAALLRLAADDVDAYLERAGLAGEARVFLETRRDALLRDADALDPPRAEPIAPPPSLPAEPEPGPTASPEEPTPTRRRMGERDVDPRRRTTALVATGSGLGASAVGLAAASLMIRQTCVVDGPCSVDWRVRPPLFVPAASLALLGTTAIVAGIATAPEISKPRTRRIVGTTTIALGSTAAVLGTVTAAIVGVRWNTPLSPSNDGLLRSTQALGNTSLASFTAALPLLSAGVTAWLSGRRARAGHGRVARRPSHRG